MVNHTCRILRSDRLGRRGEKLKAQLRVELFNVLNNTNLQAQTQFIFDGMSKLISSIGAPLSPSANTSRQIQIGLRLLF